MLLAREAASLVAISEGRFTLGVGAGHTAHENERAGLPFDENPVRAAKLGRWLGAVRAELVVLGHGDLPILVGDNGRSVLTLRGDRPTPAMTDSTLTRPAGAVDSRSLRPRHPW